MASFSTNDGVTLSYSDSAPTGREARAGRAVLVEDCGHTVAIDQPDQLIEELGLLLHHTEPSA